VRSHSRGLPGRSNTSGTMRALVANFGDGFVLHSSVEVPNGAPLGYLAAGAPPQPVALEKPSNTRPSKRRRETEKGKPRHTMIGKAKATALRVSHRPMRPGRRIKSNSIRPSQTRTSIECFYVTPPPTRIPCPAIRARDYQNRRHPGTSAFWAPVLPGPRIYDQIA